MRLPEPSARPWRLHSIPGFASVADSKNNDLFSVVVIQGDIGPLAKLNYPFAKLWRQLFDRTSNLRVFAERFHAVPDRLDGVPRGIPAFRSQKTMQAGQVLQSRLGPPQTWHLGMAARLPASSLASQTSASSAVTCRPVV